MEEGVINSIKSSHLKEIFTSSSFVTSTDGSGNNWAQGYSEYGPMYHEDLLESIRKESESCDSLASFFLIHSVGGGTGSGLGSYLTQILEDVYPGVIRFNNCIFSGGDGDVVTSPYNRYQSFYVHE